MYFSMRKGNKADYLIGGELVKGAYEVPDFHPRVIVDGGANIGMFALSSKSYFPDAELVCYEPDHDNFRQLLKNMELNYIQAITHQLGLWSKTTTLYYHSQSSYDGFIDEHPPGIPIACTLPEIKPECWLKLDIEGAEYEVLPTLLENGQYPRHISMEVHHFSAKAQPLFSLLRKHGYTLKGDDVSAIDCSVISAYRLS